MKGSGCSLENLNQSPQGDASVHGSSFIWRRHLKQNKLNYQPLFTRGAYASRPNLKDCWKSSLKPEINSAVFIIPSGALWKVLFS